MEFKYYLKEQIKKHPSVMPQDIAKICYQAAMGAEHLLMDISAAKRYFDAEFAATESRDGELIECLSDEICRVDLGVWKAEGFSPEDLFEAFVTTAKVKRGGRDILKAYLDEAEECFLEVDPAFSLEEWKAFLEEYEALGMPAVHHSGRYRESEKPAYRIVGRELLPQSSDVEKR